LAPGESFASGRDRSWRGIVLNCRVRSGNREPRAVPNLVWILMAPAQQRLRLPAAHRLRSVTACWMLASSGSDSSCRASVYYCEPTPEQRPDLLLWPPPHCPMTPLRLTPTPDRLTPDCLTWSGSSHRRSVPEPPMQPRHLPRPSLRYLVWALPDLESSGTN